MASIYSVSIDAQQVSKAVKGLRAVLHCNYRSPTGRQMIFVTRNSNNEVIDKKTNSTLSSHYEAIVNEKRLYRKIGIPITQMVKLQDRQSVTIQQAICSIPGCDGKQLFAGVECMGETETVVFTRHKKYNNEARKTVSFIHNCRTFWMRKVMVP